MHVEIIIHEDIPKPRIFICDSGTRSWGKRMECFHLDAENSTVKT